MRLPVTPQISTKDGVSNKNARMTNVLKETRATGELACVRPGLEVSDTFSGIGNGLIPFDGRLLVIFDSTVTDTEIDSLPWPLDSEEWDASTEYGKGETVWYGGVLLYSAGDGNIGNTPGTDTSWVTSLDETWDASTTYDIGDSVIIQGVTYYSTIGNNLNVNQNPLTAPEGFWTTTPIGPDIYETAGWEGADRYASCQAYVSGNYAGYPLAQVVGVTATHCQYLNQLGAGPYSVLTTKL